MYPVCICLHAMHLPFHGDAPLQTGSHVTADEEFWLHDGVTMRNFQNAASNHLADSRSRPADPEWLHHLPPRRLARRSPSLLPGWPRLLPTSLEQDCSPLRENLKSPRRGLSPANHNQCPPAAGIFVCVNRLPPRLNTPKAFEI